MYISFYSKILRHIWQSEFPANTNIELVYNIYVNTCFTSILYSSYIRLLGCILSQLFHQRMNENHVDDSVKADINLKCDNRGSIDCDLWYTRIIYRFIIISNLESISFLSLFEYYKHVSLHLQLYSDLRHERARKKKLSRMLRCIALSLNPPVSPCRKNFSVERRIKKTRCTSSFDFFAHKQRSLRSKLT